MLRLKVKAVLRPVHEVRFGGKTYALRWWDEEQIEHPGMDRREWTDTHWRRLWQSRDSLGGYLIDQQHRMRDYWQRRLLPKGLDRRCGLVVERKMARRASLFWLRWRIDHSTGLPVHPSQESLLRGLNRRPYRNLVSALYHTAILEPTIHDLQDRTFLPTTRIEALVPIIEMQAEWLERRQWTKQLWRALSQLPEKQRRAYLLRNLADLPPHRGDDLGSHALVGTYMGETEANVRQLYARAHSALASAMAEHEDRLYRLLRGRRGLWIMDREGRRVRLRQQWWGWLAPEEFLALSLVLRVDSSGRLQWPSDLE